MLCRLNFSALALASSVEAVNCGMIVAASTAMMTTTMRTSISVKPWRVRRDFITFCLRYARPAFRRKGVVELPPCQDPANELASNTNSWGIAVGDFRLPYHARFHH